MTKKRGFTLVELLTVIVIIALMSMVTMKLIGYVGVKTGKSRAARDIERVKHALTEYYSVYGCYPPTDGTTWERFFVAPTVNPAGGMMFRDGLCKYLLPTNDPSSEKWTHYLEGIWGEKLVERTASGASGNARWTNSIIHILDPWGHEYMYSSPGPDYQSYRLYSVGPDGKDSSDDIGKSWSE
ncbi:MAG: type II secretion system protein GspG [Kiritimatiellia bacterium]